MMNSFSKIEVNKKKEPKEALMRESLEPLIITTRKKIYIPEKRIIFMNQITDQEEMLLKNVTNIWR